MHVCLACCRVYYIHVISLYTEIRTIRQHGTISWWERDSQSTLWDYHTDDSVNTQLHVPCGSEMPSSLCPSSPSRQRSRAHLQRMWCGRSWSVSDLTQFSTNRSVRRRKAPKAGVSALCRFLTAKMAWHKRKSKSLCLPTTITEVGSNHLQAICALWWVAENV